VASDPEIHKWAQSALDKFNGTYGASDINLNALVHLYGIRDDVIAQANEPGVRQCEGRCVRAVVRPG